MHFSPFPVTAQKKDELDRSELEFIKRVACPNLLTRSPFPREHVINHHDVAARVPRLTGEVFDDAVCSIPRPSIVAPVPYNPPPLMYPCASFALPMHAPLINWTSIGTGKEIVGWTPNNPFMTHQFFSGKCKSSLCLFRLC